MSLAVVTLQFGDRPYFGVSRRALERYTAAHGYGLLVSRGVVFSDGRDARWSKVDAMIEALATHDRVLYLDGDALPVDPRRPVSELDALLADRCMLVGLDSVTHANTGVMLACRSALDVLEHWRAVPGEHPETKQTWPVDELAFNRYTLPAFRERVALCRGPRTDADFLNGSFVRHFCNGSGAQKAARLNSLVATWPQEK